MNDIAVRRTGKPKKSAPVEDAARLVAAAEALLNTSGLIVTDAGDTIDIRAVLDQIPDYLYVKDRQSRFVLANAPTARDNPVKVAEAMIGITDFEMFDRELAQGFFDVEQQIMTTGRAQLDIEETLVDEQGRTFWRLTSKLPLRNADGDIIGLIGVSRDITERKHQEALRSGQANLLEMIARSEPLPAILETLVRLIESQLSGISGSILLLDDEGLHLHQGVAPNLPEAYNKLIDGIAIGPNVGSCGTAAWTAAPVIVSDVMTDARWADFRGLVAQFGFRSCWSTPILTPQGDVLGTFALYSCSVREPQESEMQLVAMATHIAGIAIERKRAEDRIHFMAHHDALTGLPNRTFFKEKIAQLLFQAKHAGHKVTVAYIDLDNFKNINDSLGHSGGDELLRQLAARMLQSTRASDVVVRIGGDEFVLVLAHQSGSDAEILPRLQALRAAISQPLLIGGRTVVATCSMGIASFPEDGDTPEALIASADSAMYHAKELGRDTLHVHDGSQGRRTVERSNLQEELRTAIAGDQLFVQYQPQIDVVSARILGLEALVRWNHPRLGQLPPSAFIDMAEETGLIIPLGVWVLRTACRQNKAWQDMGLPPVIVGVNVSARQFCDPGFPAEVTAALSESGLDARYLELELTETTVMQDVPRALAAMLALEALGIRLSIDDFGTGYSNLMALKTFPVHRLKMDRSFVGSLPHNATALAIANAVLSLARDLNLSVIAEGVETDEQMSYLRDSGCNEAQGFHFSRPVDPAAIETLLRIVS